MMIRQSFTSAILVLSSMALLGAGCTKAMRKARLISKANDDYAAAQYDKAEIEYRSALQIPPVDPVPIGQLGMIYFQEGRTIEAYRYLKKAGELDPTNLDVALKLGTEQLTLGDFKSAADAAKKVLASRPGDEDAWVLLTAASRTSAGHDEVRQLVESFRKQNPDQAGFHLALGLLARVNRDPAAAEKEFDKALELDPKSTAALVELGSISLARRDAKHAEQYYKEAADLSPLRSNRRMTYIEFKIRTGALDDAKKMLADINRDAPDYIPALIDVMKLAFAERRFDDCGEAIKKILARDPMNYEALTQRGDLKLALGDSNGAVQDFQRTDDIYKRIPQVKLDLAVSELRDGNTAAAENALTQALAISPNFDAANLLLAEVDIRKGDPAAAVSILTKLIQQKPKLLRAYTLLAEAYQSQKSPAQALAVYDRMAALEPKNPQVPLLAGMVWAQENQLQRARNEFEIALQIAPDYGPALEKLVDIDLMQKRYGEATVRVETLNQKFPKAAAPWVLRAKIRMAQNDLAGAESDLLKAIDLDPKLQTAYLMLSRIYVYTNKVQQAIDKLSDLAKRTDSVAALMQLGLLHYDLKRYDDARADYERLLAVNPKYTPALNNLAYLYCEKLNRLDRAFDIATQARTYAPDDATTADTLGWILFRRGEYHNAVGLLQESAEKEPTNSEVQYHLGMAHYMLGEEDLARVAFERSVAAGADFPSKDEAVHRLALLKSNASSADPAMLAELEKRVKAEPNDPVALVRLADIQDRNGALRDAAANYESALKLNPRDVQVMLELAKLYSGPLQNLPKARELAKSAHELAPDDAQISETLGRMLFRTGDYKWSLTLLEEASRSVTGQPELTYDLARAYYSVGQVQDARTALQGLIQSGVKFDKDFEARRMLSMIDAGKDPVAAQAALPDARKILETEPDYVPAIMVSALAEEQRGNPSGAVQQYEKVLAAYHDFSPAIRQMALIFEVRADDDKRAYDLATTALNSYPDDPQLARALGILNYRREDYTSAVHFLQESQSKLPDDPEIFYYLGMSHYKLKEVGESKTELQRALDSNIPDQEADEAKRVLDELKGAQAPSLSEQPIN